MKRVQNMLRLKDISDENERLRRYIEEMGDDRGDDEVEGDNPEPDSSEENGEGEGQGNF